MMFTGLIESVGSVARVRTQGNYLIMTVKSALPHEEIQIGESIACQGACLTVVSRQDGLFEVEISQETIACVDAGRFGVGRQINLERAVQAGGRLGGHLVSGHIDTVGRVESLRPVGRSLELAVGFDPKYDPLVIDKGSVAVDGVSLTVNECSSGLFTVNLIPHTSGATTLSDLKAADPVNLEFDMIGKYILKYKQSGSSQGVTAEILRKSGW
jgi:riboflavin synthase